jgi:hypothetical protein
MNTYLVVLALATSIVSPALSAPTRYWYGNLLVVFQGRAFLTSGIPLGTLGWIPNPIPGPLSMSLVISNPLVPEFVLKLFLSLALPITDAMEGSEHDYDDSEN